MICSCRDIDYYIVFLPSIVSRMDLDQDHSGRYYWPNCGRNYIWETLGQYLGVSMAADVPRHWVRWLDPDHI